MDGQKVYSVPSQSTTDQSINKFLFGVLIVTTIINCLLINIFWFGNLILFGIYYRILVHWTTKHEIPRGKTIFGIILTVLFIITRIGLPGRQ